MVKNGFKILLLNDSDCKSEPAGEYAEQYKFSSAIDYAGGKGLLKTLLAW